MDLCRNRFGKLTIGHWNYFRNMPPSRGCSESVHGGEQLLTSIPTGGSKLLCQCGASSSILHALGQQYTAVLAVLPRAFYMLWDNSILQFLVIVVSLLVTPARRRFVIIFLLVILCCDVMQMKFH